MRVLHKNIKRGMMLLIIAALIPAMLSFSVSADYYVTDTELGRQGISRTYEVKKTIGNFDSIQQLANPLDLFIDSKDNTYILDSDNGRIVVLDENDEIKRTISGNYGRDNLPLNKPEGLYVDSIGDIFIADTQNSRIVHLNATGEFVEEFFQPSEDTYDQSYPFKPSKIYVDDLGKLLIVNQFDWHGIIKMDGNNKFGGYLSGSKIKFNLNDYIIRMFATQEQKDQIARETPPYFSNFLMKDSLIYSTSYWGDSEQIKKHTPSGTNIFPKKMYGEYNDKTNFNFRPGFVDIAVDNDGIIYAADMVTSLVYVYGQEGDNLAVFGGESRREGHFSDISSIAVNSKGELYVLDRGFNTIQVFTPTQLMREITVATSLYNQGRYEEAMRPWQNVLELDSTNFLASVGLAKAKYRMGDYSQSMVLYMNSFDKSGYSAVFNDFRIDFFRRNFSIIFLGMLAFLISLIYLVSRLKKCADKVSESTVADGARFGFKGHMKATLLMIFHPIDCFNSIKANRTKITPVPMIGLMSLIVAVRIAYVYIVHFPLADLSVVSVDLWQLVALILVPLVSWIVINFAITSISDGKQTFKEAILASLYSFMPYIIFTIPLALLSRIMGVNERGLYDSLTAIVLLWSIALLLLSNQIMNQYSFAKLVGTVLKTLFGILCLWMICMLFYVVLYQAWDFFDSIYTEFNIIING